MTHDRQHSGKANGQHSRAPKAAEARAIETEAGPGSQQDGEPRRVPHADDSSRMSDEALMRCYNG